MVHYVFYRGEGADGYSMSLRQCEFISAFRAEVKLYLLNNDFVSISDESINLQNVLNSIQIKFIDALIYRGPVYDPKVSFVQKYRGSSSVEPVPLSQVRAYESAMQYIIISMNDSCNLVYNMNTLKQPELIADLIKDTVERCSLVRTMIKLVAKGNTYKDAAINALRNGSFDDMMIDGENKNE